MLGSSSWMPYAPQGGKRLGRCTRMEPYDGTVKPKLLANSGITVRCDVFVSDGVHVSFVLLTFWHPNFTFKF
jgi:hypothetical protein